MILSHFVLNVRDGSAVQPAGGPNGQNRPFVQSEPQGFRLAEEQGAGELEDHAVLQFQLADFTVFLDGEVGVGMIDIRIDDIQGGVFAVFARTE